MLWTVVFFLSIAAAQAGQVTLAWNASAGPVAGYQVYYGTTSGHYTAIADAGNSTQYIMADLADGATYYFVVRAYDGAGNQSGFSNEASATLPAVAPAPVANFSANSTSGTAPLTVQFSNSSTNATTWSWNFGDNTSSAAQNPSKTYSSAGTYTVSLTATGSGGSHTVTKTNYISVTAPTTAAPVASFTATPTSGAAPLTVTLTDTSSGSITKRTWNFGDGVSQTVETAQTFMKTYDTSTMSTDYTVKLTVTGPGGSSTATQVISATAVKPTADFSASSTTGMAPLATTFTNASTGTISGYAWDFGDGVTSTDAYPAHTYPKAGDYTVKLTATGPAGADTKTGSITVAENGLVAAYGFEEASGTTATDISGNGNHGVINGATRTAGKFGQALSFNGSSDWVAIPDADSLDLTTAMTLSAWIHPNSLSRRQPILAKQGTTKGSPTRGYMLSAGDDKGKGMIEAEVFKNDNSKSSLFSSAALNTSGWQHVAFVYQYVGNGTSKMTLYINGVAKGSSTTAVGPVQKNAQPLDLGRYYWNSGYARYFNGLIDEVRIYNRALSATEIQADMNKAVAF